MLLRVRVVGHSVTLFMSISFFSILIQNLRAFDLWDFILMWLPLLSIVVKEPSLRKSGSRINYVSIIGRTGGSQSSRIQVHHQKWLVDALRQIDVIRGKDKIILDE